MDFLVLQKYGRERFAGIHLRLTLHQIRTLTYLFLSLTTWRQKIRNKTLIVCSVLVVSLKTTMEKTRYHVRNDSDGCTHFVLVWRKILWALSGINTVLFVVCILCIFFYFVTILCDFCVNYLAPEIRNTCAPDLGRWNFLRKRVLHTFFFS